MLKDYLNGDLTGFFNAGEFADAVNIDGTAVNIVIDEDRLILRKNTNYGDLDAGNILFFAPRSSFATPVVSGNAMLFCNKPCTVTDVKISAGVYEIVLEYRS